MEKFNELLAELQALDITQKSGDWAEDLPEGIWENHFKDNYKKVASGLEVIKHRWYETSTTVFKVHGGLLGVHCVTNIFSESMDWEDCYMTINFEEMKEVQTITYESV